MMEAYKRKEMTQKTLAAFRRIVDQRKYLGRKYGPRSGRTSSRSSAESLIAAYKNETQRQRLLVKKAKLCEAKLLASSAAFRALSLIQEHAMIMRAITNGVTAAQIAKALDVDIAKIKASLNLLDGIHPDAVELLKDKPITAGALRLFRKAKAVRQIDMAQLMVGANNFTKSYAEALVVGSRPEQLVEAKNPKATGISAEEITRMEKEMELLERDYKLHQDQFGENALHLNGVQRYVKRLLDNARVKKFLGNRYPEILEEFLELAALDAL